MREAHAMSEPFDLSVAHVALGDGASATVIPDFQWTPEFLDDLQACFADQREEMRLVVIVDQNESWDTWERHPVGEEVVVLLEGKVDLIQEIDGAERVVELTAGHAVVNPPGVWHTATVHEPGRGLFITPGRGTEHRPR